MCSSLAFIDREAYGLATPPRDAKGFEMWQADVIVNKYPTLLESYDILRECWDTYDKKPTN